MIEPEMASKVHHIVAEIASDLASPRVVAAIDKAIAEFQQAQASLSELRKAALRLHSSAAPAPVLPVATTPSEELRPPPQPQTNERTIKSLVEDYRVHADSPFQNIRFRTRENYNSLLRRIADDCGERKLSSLKAQDVQLLHERWTARGAAIAYSLVSMLRMLFGFGATVLQDAECERLSVVMAKIEFKVERGRSERLTAEQATAIRAMAHKVGRPSIALAQAFQFECPALRQKDVIGEWVPLAEQGSSEIIHDGRKWIRGLRWNQIDENLILRHVTSFGAKNVEVDLTQAPMVMQELMMLGERPKGSEPIIICEYSGRPWTAYEFRRWWRKVADACRIPKEVKNMDSRPGATNDERTKDKAGQKLNA
jgi:hypothetical protein